MDVVFIGRVFPLYRRAVYDMIFSQKKFVFLHGVDNRLDVKQIRTEYSSVIRTLHYGNRRSRAYLFTLAKLIQERPKVVVHEFSAGILSIPPLIAFCRLLKIKLVFWGHTHDRAQGFFPEKRISDRYRRWLWQKAAAMVTYSENEKGLLERHGVPADKIFVAYNTVDTNSFLAVRDRLEETGREEIKNRLGFSHKYNLIFIGRIYKEKKPELLLELLHNLTANGLKSVAAHFIGEGEMVPYLRQKTIELGLENDVFFHGAIYDEVKTGEFLFCSDLMIMPGCVGLSVNHAFCFNCPVVTFKEVNLNPAHGPEIEYVVHRKTGFVISNQTMEELVSVVLEYLDNPTLRTTMQAKIKHLIENECSIEKMAQGVIDAIECSIK